jgi:putative DNA primase/helicase
MTAAAELLRQHGITLDDTTPGRHYAICPQCSKNRSKQNAKCLGVTIEADDSVRWGCNHCGWTGPTKGDGQGENFETKYDYQDADGKLIFQKVRKVPKGFYCRRQDGGGGWINNMKGITDKPLYRWPEVLKAIAADREIAIVEGEKDADNLWRIDIPATTNFDGAADITKSKKPKWKPRYSEDLRDARIIVFNDNDQQGIAHAEAICRMSQGICVRVRRLDLAPHWPEIPKGGDVSDWLALGHSREDLDRLIEGAPEVAAASAVHEAPRDDDDVEIERLAKLTPFEFERCRKDAADALGVRAAILDRLVGAKRAELGLHDGDGKQGRAVEYDEPVPWDAPVDGAGLLDQIAKAVRRFVVLPKHGAEITALWCVHTYCLDGTDVTPRLDIEAPFPDCGKSTYNDFLEQVVYRPDSVGNMSMAAFFRTVEEFRPTLLIDDLDSFVTEESEIRNAFNTGHHLRGSVKRTVGDNHEVRTFSTFAALAFNHIGELPSVYNTLTSRSINITLARRLATEKIESLSGPRRRNEFAELRRKLKRWANDNTSALASAEPVMPADLINRAADNWRPLLAIADACGGKWPEWVRAAIIQRDADSVAEGSIRELLLAHIREIFDRVSLKDGFISSTNLAVELAQIEGGPWAEYGKSRKPITTHALQRLLKPLKIGSGKNAARDTRGYKKRDFEDAFARYLTAVSSPKGDFALSKCPSVPKADEMGTSGLFPKCPEEAFGTLAKSDGNADGTGIRDTWDTSKAGNGQTHDAGLSQRAIDDLADRVRSFAADHVGDADASAAINLMLTRWLAESGVLREHIATEAARVMDAVFDA